MSMETLTEAVVWPVSFYCVGKIATAAPDETTEPEVFEFAVRALQATAPLATNEDAAYYQNQATPLDGQGLPVDFNSAVDGILWVAVLAGNGADSTQMGNALINLGFSPDPTAPPSARYLPVPVRDLHPLHRRLSGGDFHGNSRWLGQSRLSGNLGGSRQHSGPDAGRRCAFAPSPEPIELGQLHRFGSQPGRHA